jgi:hypothetical protein
VKKIAAHFLRSALKKKNKVEEGGASSLGTKREHESTYLRAQKMMKGKVEPSAVPIVVRAVPIVVRAVPIVVRVVPLVVQVVRQTS